MSYCKPTVPQSRPPCDLPSENPSKSFWHSEPSPLLTAHRTTRELPKTADVVIIGSGITGASVAHHLLNDGSGSSDAVKKGEDYSVVMLEAREACWGATGRNGGHCQPVLFAHPHDPSIGHFELENFRTLQSLIEAKKIDCEFVVQPGVRTFYSRRLWNEVELAVLTCQETSPKLAELMTLVTDRNELAKLRVPTATGAVVTKIAARMWPYKFVARILEDLVMSSELRGSFNLQTFTPVESLDDNGADGWIVNTPRGTIKAAKVVLATNAYTSHLMPNFADLIVPVRGQMSALEPWPSVAEKSRLKTSFGFDGEAIDEYLIQRPNERGGHLMYGGGRQIGGPTVGVADDSVFDAPIAEYLQQSLIDRLALPEGHKLREAIRTARCDFCVRSQFRCWRVSLRGSCASCQRDSLTCTNGSPSIKPSDVQPPGLHASFQWTGIMGYSRDEHPWVGAVPGKRNLFMSAGYTGHGMPNTWLCGKAVATMLGDDSRQTPSILPASYMVTEKRIKKAMEEHEDVGAVDWAEMERARRKLRTDRMPSGYA